MIRHTATWTMAMLALTCAGSLEAHHSIGMFDISTAVWVSGTVVRYEPVNPHAMIELEERRADGQVQRWTIEGPSVRRLSRIVSIDQTEDAEGFLKVGDIIEVCGFAMLEQFRSRSSSRGADGTPLPFVHGHMFVMPDGRKRSWGPYGRIDNCVRANDPTAPWLEFLNTDPPAREFWCRRDVSGSSQAPQAFVDEINGMLANPCR